MYKYSDFKDKLGDKYIQLKLFDIYNYMMEDAHYTTEELFKPVSGDSWETLACIDRLEELRLIRCIYNEGSRNYWRYKKV